MSNHFKPGEQVYIEDGTVNTFYIDCPKCGGKYTIEVERDETPGCRDTYYTECKNCGFKAGVGTK